MKRRYTKNASGQFVARDGTMLGAVPGSIVAITMDEDESRGVGGSSGLSDNNNDNDKSSPIAPAAEFSAEQVDAFGGSGVMVRSRPDRALVAAAVDAVWDHYVKVMKPRNVDCGPEERKIIREALNTATVAECKRAIDGCKASPFHMGENDRHKKYNRLSQILKGKRGGKTTREQIDMFLDVAEKAGVQSGFTSADHARVQQAKRDVLDGWEFPNDARVVERANEAKAWLKEQGWTIEYAEGGRPQFVQPSA